MWSVILTTGASLVIACVVFAAFEWRTQRLAMLDKTDTLARVIGINSVAALSFDDAAAAEETLEALSAVAQIRGAALFDQRGRLFASYANPGVDFLVPAPEMPGRRFDDDELHVFQDVTFQGERVGRIYVSLDTSHLVARMQLYAGIFALLFVLAAICSALVASRLRQQISRPLTELVESSKAITDGDLSTKVAEATSDEIGVLARTFNAMTAGLRTLVLQVRQGIGEVAEVSRALEERADSLFQDATRQSTAITEANASIDRVAGSIREVNANVEQLAETSEETSTSILQMDASIGEVASHMDELTGAIDTTSAAVTMVTSNIQQVVGGVDTLQAASAGTAERLRELGASVAAIEANAAESRTLSEDSSREASEGMTAVGETIQSMTEISTSFGQLEQCVSGLAERSQSIDEIVQVIQDVAEQTGLLSLNAAIIAAQAGEHGRAFSVVAEQVNALADRTQKSAREIADLIQAVQADTRAAVSAVEEGSARVESGVQRSNVAGKVLDRIIEKTGATTSRVRDIADATRLQASDLERVEGAVQEVEQIVRAIGQSTHDQQLATEEIARAVDNIRNLGAAVRHSTDEQRRSSGLITQAAGHVTEMVSHIAEATGEQTRNAETIEQTLRVFADVSEAARRGAEAITGNVATLLERASRLEDEAERFKTE
jgi:methyl-accepting chemotaxis protein